MTSARILYPQFRDEQSDSRYPFADTASLVSESASVAFTSSTFIDAAFFIIGAAGRVHLSTVTVTAQTVTITVASDENGVSCSASFDISAIPQDGLLTFFDIYGRAAGRLLSTYEKLALFTTWDIGTYSFLAEATEFVSSVVTPANEPGVRGIMTAKQELLTNNLWLVGDAGVQLSVVDGHTIRIDIIGEPLFKRFLCEPNTNFPTKKFLKTINGCGPDEYGNFTITATNHNAPTDDDTVLRVYPQNGTIVVDSVGRSNI